MIESFTLPNYGIVKSKLPNKLYSALLEECLSYKNNDKFISGLTEPGVANHFYVEKNKDNIANFISEMVNVYNQKYPNYSESIKILNKSTGAEFQDPWINIQKYNEYIPVHDHDGIFSYNIWMKLPTKSIFEFNYSTILGTQTIQRFILEKQNEGTVILFPSLLRHTVYPFQKTKNIRISIAGNILLKGE